MNVEVAREISLAVRTALGKRGAGGRVEVREGKVWLVTSGGSWSVDVGGLEEQWGVLPPAVQAKKVTEIAAALSSQRGGGGGGFALPNKPTYVIVGVGSVVLALLVILVVVTFSGLDASAPDAAGADAGAADAAEEARERARVQASCEAARNRLIAGANVTALDTQGWVIELWLAGSERAATTLGSVIDTEGHLKPTVDEDLAKVDAGRVELGPGLAPKGTTDAVGATLVFSGGYARAYLDPLRRSRLIAVADDLATQAGATHGALYGRCAHLTQHDMGAWFRGADAGAAAASMMFALGLFADTPAVDRKWSSGSGADALAALDDGARRITTERLAVLVGTDGGSLTATDAPAALTVTFSAAVSTAAIISTRVVAKELGVAP